VAVLPAHAGDPFVHELRTAGIECRTSLPAGEIRVNLALTEPDGTTTKLNSPGEVVGPEHLAELTATLVREARGSSWVVLAGSLPPGAPTGYYADLVRLLHGQVPVAVDTSEGPLAELVEGLPASAPDLLKPNAEELASVTGVDVADLEADPVATARAARLLVERGVGTVLVTLGAHGAVLLDREGAWQALPPPTTVVSTVGAGDSSLFGYLLAQLHGLPPADRLALAVAYGSAAAALPGTTIPTREQVRPDAVRVRRLPVPQHT
jgi:1-phosphofructokinase